MLLRIQWNLLCHADYFCGNNIPLVFHKRGNKASNMFLKVLISAQTPLFLFVFECFDPIIYVATAVARPLKPAQDNQNGGIEQRSIELRAKRNVLTRIRCFQGKTNKKRVTHYIVYRRCVLRQSSSLFKAQEGRRAGSPNHRGNRA